MTVSLRTVLNDVWDHANHQLRMTGAPHGVSGGGSISEEYIMNDVWDSVNHVLKTAGGGGGSGSVTSFSAGALAPLFTTTVETPTTTPALSFALSNAAANAVFAGPTTGGAGAPSYRALVAADVNPAFAVTPAISASVSVLQMGNGGFAGGAGNFAGNIDGTMLGINMAANDGGAMIDAQLGGKSIFSVTGTEIVLGNNTSTKAYVQQAFVGDYATQGAGRPPLLINWPNSNIVGIGGDSLSTTDNLLWIGAVSAVATDWLTSGVVNVAIPNGYLGFGTASPSDTQIQRSAAHSLLFGAAASAAPASYTLTGGESARGGTDTNVAGGGLTLATGAGTGTGAATSMLFRTSVVAASGTTAQALATQLTLGGGTYAGQFAGSVLLSSGSVIVPLGSSSQYSYQFNTTPTSGWFVRTTGSVNWGYNGSSKFELDPGRGLLLDPSLGFAFATYGGSVDVALYRNAAGVMEFNSGTAGTYRDAKARNLITAPTTVASLAGAAEGARASVTDATVAFTAGIGAVVAGGGSNHVPVYYDGTNWRIG